MNTEKLRSSIEKIGPLILPDMLKFWMELQENDEAEDLAQNIR